MTDQHVENITVHSFEITLRFTKWFVVQYISLFFMPYIRGNSLSTGLSVCIATHTMLYSIYWNIVSAKKRLKLIGCPVIWQNPTKSSHSKNMVKKIQQIPESEPNASLLFGEWVSRQGLDSQEQHAYMKRGWPDRYTIASSTPSAPPWIPDKQDVSSR